MRDSSFLPVSPSDFTSGTARDRRWRLAETEDLIASALDYRSKKSYGIEPVQLAAMDYSAVKVYPVYGSLEAGCRHEGNRPAARPFFRWTPARILNVRSMYASSCGTSMS